MPDIIEKIQQIEDDKPAYDTMKDRRKIMLERYYSKKDRNEVKEKRRQMKELCEKWKHMNNSYNRWGGNEKKFVASMDFLISTYETSLAILEENDFLRERTDDEIFADKNRQIGELEDMLAKEQQKQWKTFSMEESQTISDWYREHLTTVLNPKDHKLTYSCHNSALGPYKQCTCSCGLVAPIEDEGDDFE